MQAGNPGDLQNTLWGNNPPLAERLAADAAGTTDGGPEAARLERGHHFLGGHLQFGLFSAAAGEHSNSILSVSTTRHFKACGQASAA
jgi:hypothetical protein